ncbi:alpha/beta hydrolase family protein [Streptomyces flavofungini]|uniref:alpha/beta hydrolase family protein n=1 Tax=Streptomyces flavofungini TaxID=68200 RepID=UPI0025B125D0|nr:hypothetical protein [Streptomyces flavofungini]WJV50190.1 hypothetical protein QUY26_34540 [Streptomyces flavofungini]
MIHVPRSVTAAAAVLALAAGVPGLAHAQPSADRIPPASPRPVTSPDDPTPPEEAEGQLPKGWRVDGAGARKELVWQAPRAVPMGDSRVEFYSGDRLLGVPVPHDDQRTFRLRLDDTRVGPAAELRAQAGGRRLDEAAKEAPRVSPPAASAEESAPLPANRVDPGVPGKYRTVSGEYTQKSVRLPGFRAPVEMRGTVVGPVDAPGKRPLALFLHGRHYTCYNARGDQDGGWPCKGGMKPVPSHRGYLHDQKLLASQGYVTVSIAANGINGQDDVAEDGGAEARSSLVRQHLGRWADWAAGRGDVPGAVRATAPADLSRVLLVGHSRGGEGVNRAALDSLAPPPATEDGAVGPARWTIRGTVLIGPTIFGQNPVPDVPSMTVLPGCDGDVSDLQGQIYADGTRGVSRGTALHSAVYVVGANHNFFNSEWTPGQAEAPANDDFSSGSRPDAVCAKGKDTRLTAKQQQKAGSTYIAAAARLFVGGDDRVRPLLDGSGRRAPSAKPARVLTHAVGGNRTPAFVPNSSLGVSGGRLCAQVDRKASRSCLAPDVRGSSPHFAVWGPSPEPGRHAVAMRWTRTGTPTKLRPKKPVSLAGADKLALRVIVPPNTRGTRLDVTVTDASGHRAKLGQVRVDGLPGTEMTSSYWGREVRLPLSAAARAGLDLKQVMSLELTPQNRSGRAWLMDAWGWRPGTPDAGTADLARVDIGRLKVDEGDSGVRTYKVPVRVSGQGTGKVRLFVTDSRTQRTTNRIVTVRPGGDAVEVPVTVRGDKRYGTDTSHEVMAKAISSAVVGSHQGGVLVRNDDPMPKVSVRPIADRVTEGKALKWRVTLSEAADTDIEAGFELRRVTSGTELSTKDVSKRWLKETFDRSPNPARRLSKVSEMPYVPAGIAAGKRSVVVSVPTVKDRVRESKETVRLRLLTYDQSWQPHPGPTVTGTVRDPA